MRERLRLVAEEGLEAPPPGRSAFKGQAEAPAALASTKRRIFLQRGTPQGAFSISDAAIDDHRSRSWRKWALGRVFFRRPMSRRCPVGAMRDCDALPMLMSEADFGRNIRESHPLVD